MSRSWVEICVITTIKSHYLYSRFNNLNIFSNIMIQTSAFHILFRLVMCSLCHVEMLMQLLQREKEAGIKPDPDIDMFMKVWQLQFFSSSKFLALSFLFMMFKRCILV